MLLLMLKLVLLDILYMQYDSLRCDYEARADKIAAGAGTAAARIAKVVAIAEASRRGYVFQPIIGASVVDRRL